MRNRKDVHDRRVAREAAARPAAARKGDRK